MNSVITDKAVAKERERDPKLPSPPGESVWSAADGSEYLAGGELTREKLFHPFS